MAAQVIPYAANQMLRSLHQSDHPEPTVMTVLVSDNSLLCSGLQRILRGTPFTPAVTASIANPRLVQDMVSEPALALIEANRNTGHVLEVVRQVRERSPGIRIMALADQFDLGFVLLAHEAGVNGFWLAASGPAVLIKSLELVMLGEPVLPLGALRSIMDRASQDRGQPLQNHTVKEPKLPDLTDCKLSAREAEILTCLMQGAPNKIIACKLDISEATVKVHVKAILRKIGAANRTQAAMWASQRLSRCIGTSASV